MSDLIERQAVLDAFWKLNVELRPSAIDAILSMVNDMPSVSTEKTGRWIEEKDDYGEVIGWHCDKCYEDSGFTTDCKWHYCPNCGAKMEEVEE